MSSRPPESPLSGGRFSLLPARFAGLDVTLALEPRFAGGDPVGGAAAKAAAADYDRGVAARTMSARLRTLTIRVRARDGGVLFRFERHILEAITTRMENRP